MLNKLRIAPCLWFDGQAEEAANDYVEIFDDSRIVLISRFGEAGKEIHGGKPGSVLSIAFELEGQPFTALNGGPLFKFNEAMSLQILCDTQEEIDYYWQKLSARGDKKAQQCGWLKDRFGVSWQVTPSCISWMLADSDHKKTARAMTAMLKMKKIKIADLERAYNG